jgi:hypothetical protein
MTKAGKLWEAGEQKRFEFSEAAAEVVGSAEPGMPNPQTIALAAEIKRSTSTVYDYAMVGRLWRDMLRRYSSWGEAMRDCVQFGFWRAIAKHYSKGVSLFVCGTWLQEASTFDGTLEEFRDMLPKPTQSNGFGRWVRRLSNLAQDLYHEADGEPDKQRKSALKEAAEAVTRAHEALLGVDASGASTEPPTSKRDS